METIGLIAAMPQESEALLRCIEQWEHIALGPLKGARFRLIDRDCLLVTSGMGLKRAADGARALLAAAKVHWLVSFGIAGAVKDDLQIGDVVIAGKTCLLDEILSGTFWPLASLSEMAWDAAARTLRPDGARLVAGTAITTRGSQVAPQLLEDVVNPVLEMETAGIAPVAAGAGVPLLSIRSISDGPQAPIPFNLEVVLDEESNLRMGKVLMAALRRPQIILQSWRMMRNSRKAADSAAKAVAALLSQPSPIIAP
ncbi:MAG: hypothetical protein JXB30_13530 [Anaerolineae bacterium]|nr:hypothetical protein [Anaerolineae bacterium]